MSIFDDALTGINDLISGVGGVTNNLVNQAGGIFNSLSDIAKTAIANDTIGANVNSANQNPANESQLSKYFTVDNAIMIGGGVLFIVAIYTLLKK